MLAITISLLVVAFTLVVLYRRRHFQHFEKLEIPGPKPSIWLGNTLELIKGGYIQTTTKWMNQYGPVVGFYNGWTPVLLVADVDLLKKIFIKDFTNFIDRGKMFGGNAHIPNAIVELRGQRWKEVRSVLTPSFTISKLKHMAPEVDAVAKELVEVVVENENNEFDISELFQALTLETICRTALGARYNLLQSMNHPVLQQCQKSLNFQMTLPFAIILSFPRILSSLMVFVRNIQNRMNNRGVNHVDELRRECVQVVKARRENPNNQRRDLLQLMIDAQTDQYETSVETLSAGADADKAEENRVKSSAGAKKGALSDEEVVDNALVVLIAGYDTTSNSLGLIIRMLINYPEVQDRLREEILDSVGGYDCLIDYEKIHKMKYLDAVIMEVQRLFPSIGLFTSRRAAEAREFDGVKIPEGQVVVVPTFYLHRTERYWEDPEAFKPERFLEHPDGGAPALAWQPFGAGPRNCIGMRFAQMEIKIALVRLLQRFRLVPSENSAKLPLTLGMSSVVLRTTSRALTRVERV